MRLEPFGLVDVDGEAVATVLDPIGSCGDNEILVDARRRELERHPQGPNAGDADADNHGGPSDGDGNI